MSNIPWIKTSPKVRMLSWMDIEINFFPVFLLVNQWKGKVLTTPLRLEHLVLILPFWQALALCEWKRKAHFLPDPFFSSGLLTWLCPVSGKPLRALWIQAPSLPSDALLCHFFFFCNVIMCLPESEHNVWCAWLSPEVCPALLSFWPQPWWDPD